VIWLSRPRGEWSSDATGKVRYALDAIVDATSTTRRCNRGIGANKSKGHPEAFFPLAPVVTVRGHRFSNEAHSVMKNATNRYLSLIR
jgi:hypothetical protein